MLWAQLFRLAGGAGHCSRNGTEPPTRDLRRCSTWADQEVVRPPEVAPVALQSIPPHNRSTACSEGRDTKRRCKPRRLLLLDFSNRSHQPSRRFLRRGTPSPAASVWQLARDSQASARPGGSHRTPIRSLRPFRNPASDWPAVSAVTRSLLRNEPEKHLGARISRAS